MIKELAKRIREYKISALLAPFFVIIEVLMEVIIPFLMALILDNGIANNDLDYVYKMGSILIIIAFLALIFGVLSGKFAAKAATGFAKNLRSDLYHNIQNFSFTNIDYFSSAGLITRLTTDVSNVQNAFQMILRISVRAPAMLILSLVMAFSINAQLSLVFVVVIPILIIGFYFIFTNAHPIFKRVFKKYDKLNSVVQENLQGVRVVKSFVRENYEIKKFKKVSKSIYDDFSKAEKIIAFNAPIMQFSMNLSFILLSWFGANMIVNTTLSTGQLVGLFTYTAQILISLMILSMIFVMLSISRASAGRIYETLIEKPTIINNENPLTKIKDGSITFENVDFCYGKKVKQNCLNNINLNIKSGETIGILGSTGSGKSTLVSLIPRLYDTSAGVVRVGDIDVKDYDIKTLRDEVAIVLQKNTLFNQSIKDNLKWGNRKASDEEIIKYAKIAQADSFINEFENGYDTMLEQGATNISGGQKQRLCIARALLKQPKILILDDSTSAVDTKTEKLINDALKVELPHITKIIIAQRITSVENADQIIIMDDGRIGAIGNHQQLLENNEFYQQLYELQNKGGDDYEKE